MKKEIFFIWGIFIILCLFICGLTPCEASPENKEYKGIIVDFKIISTAGGGCEGPSYITIIQFKDGNIFIFNNGYKGSYFLNIPVIIKYQKHNSGWLEGSIFLKTVEVP